MGLKQSNCQWWVEIALDHKPLLKPQVLEERPKAAGILEVLPGLHSGLPLARPPCSGLAVSQERRHRAREPNLLGASTASGHGSRPLPHATLWHRDAAREPPSRSSGTELGRW